MIWAVIIATLIGAVVGFFTPMVMWGTPWGQNSDAEPLEWFAVFFATCAGAGVGLVGSGIVALTVWLS